MIFERSLMHRLEYILHQYDCNGLEV